RWDDRDAVRDRRRNQRACAGPPPPRVAQARRADPPDSTAYTALIDLARTDPSAASRLGVGAFASLQRAIGNRAVGALILRDGVRQLRGVTRRHPHREFAIGAWPARRSNADR